MSTEQRFGLLVKLFHAYRAFRRLVNDVHRGLLINVTCTEMAVWQHALLAVPFLARNVMLAYRPSYTRCLLHGAILLCIRIHRLRWLIHLFSILHSFFKLFFDSVCIQMLGLVNTSPLF